MLTRARHHASSPHQAGVLTALAVCSVAVTINESGSRKILLDQLDHSQDFDAEAVVFVELLGALVA